MIEITYPNKKSEVSVLAENTDCELRYLNEIAENRLLFGDNLVVMKELLYGGGMRGKIDLIYIDPPFATNNTFGVGNTRTSTISGSKSDSVAYKDDLLGADFLEYIRQRLIVMRELLSETGSIYLHIDYKIGHYVKLIMDEVFGAENFRNDITRIKCNPKNFARKGYGNVKDLILFYSKGSNPKWEEPQMPYSEADKIKLFPKIDPNGRRYTTVPLHAPGETQNGKTSELWRGIKPPDGRHWRSSPDVLEQMDQDGLVEWSRNGTPRKKIFLDDQSGKRVQDIWEFKDPQYPVYPTEKNSDLLKLIIETSSEQGDFVLDCFCGSGTTLQVAQNCGRRWIGIDQSSEAIKITKQKLAQSELDLFTPKIQYCYGELQLKRQSKSSPQFFDNILDCQINI